jgi:hypothetical protein
MEGWRRNEMPRIFNLASMGEQIGVTVQSAIQEVIGMARLEIAEFTGGMMRGMGAAAMTRFGGMGRFMPPEFADGGHVRGPGGPTDDKIPAMLSNGEYVIKASSVNQYGTNFLDGLNAGRYANGGIVKLYGVDQAMVLLQKRAYSFRRKRIHG